MVLVCLFIVSHVGAQTSLREGNARTSPLQQMQRDQQNSRVNYTDCSNPTVADLDLLLPRNSPIIVSGTLVAAGAGGGECVVTNTTNGTVIGDLKASLNSNASTNVMLVAVTCVHKGVLTCRNNQNDDKTVGCAILVESIQSEETCGLVQGGRYMFFISKEGHMDKDTGKLIAKPAKGCPGYYYTAYKTITQSVRAPISTNAYCIPFPAFPDPEKDFKAAMTQCASPATCAGDPCANNPCANSTAVECIPKLCSGKTMFGTYRFGKETCTPTLLDKSTGLPTTACLGSWADPRARAMAAAERKREQEEERAQNPQGVVDPKTNQPMQAPVEKVQRPDAKQAGQPAAANPKGAAQVEATRQKLSNIAAMSQGLTPP